jgi:hypothetical protein
MKWCMADKVLMGITLAIVVVSLVVLVWGNDMGSTVEIGLLK